MDSIINISLILMLSMMWVGVAYTFKQMSDKIAN